MNDKTQKSLAVIYASLILAGRRTIHDVPSDFVDMVKASLSKDVE